MKRLAVSTAIASVLAISTYTAQASGVSLDDFTMTRADLEVMAKEAVLEDGDMQESILENDLDLDNGFAMEDGETGMGNNGFEPEGNDGLTLSDDDFEMGNGFEMDGENPFEQDPIEMDGEDPEEGDMDIVMNDENDDFEMGGNGIETGNNTSPVPVPAAFWLFGSGLLGLVGISRKKSV